ncbi:hypothetical protein [Croceicoccus sp. Ery15]|uniref:hypothetical protein n=1 Tax=Croceicoccus sp. Ery15 TaxID=1703338 RepID=UPI001E4DD58A|nr:hypothetical protein [Croceicoccus sp. Ery15]
MALSARHLDRVVVVVDRPCTSPVQNTGLFGEQPGNAGTGKMTTRGEKRGNPGTDGEGQGHCRHLLAGGKQV